MQIIDRGNGVPLVLIPGIQGRWEYMRPAVEALSRWFRVITCSLCGERGSDCEFVPDRGAENFVDQIDRVLRDRQVDRAVIAGVSFGGSIALHYAARRPNRTAALVLVSTPGPRFKPTKRHELFMRAPYLLGPILLAEIPIRVAQEIRHTYSDRRAGLQFAWEQVKAIVEAPLSLKRMAARARLIAEGTARDAGLVSAPTLLVTGERGLDYVVPVEGALEYAELIRDVRWVTIERGGHLAYITRPDTFAAIVKDFVDQSVSRRSSGEGDPHAA